MGPKDDEERDVPVNSVLYLLTVNGSKEIAILQEVTGPIVPDGEDALRAAEVLGGLMDPNNEEQYALVLGPDILLDDRRG